MTFTDTQLSQILNTHFGIEKAAFTKLEGYDSINYKVSTETDAFVLKLHPADEGTKWSLIAEHEMLARLKALEGYDFSVPMPNVRGEYLSQVNEAGQAWLVRLLRFVEGEFSGQYPTYT